MGSNFKTVFKFSFMNKINKKFIKGSLIFMIVMTSIIQGGVYVLKSIDENQGPDMSTIEIYTSNAELKSQLEANNDFLLSDEEVELKYVDAANVDLLEENEILIDLDSNIVYHAEEDIWYLESSIKELMYNIQFLNVSAKNNLSADVIAEVMQIGQYETKYAGPESEVNSSVIYGISFVLTIVSYMVIIFGLQYTGQEILEEKSSRAMEIIMSSVKPKSHMLAKILSNVSFVLTIFLVFIMTIVINVILLLMMFGVNFSDLFETFKMALEAMNLSLALSGQTVIYLFVIIGLFVMTLLGITSIGAILVSPATAMEELAKKQSLLTLMILVPYMINIMGSGSEMDIVKNILVYIPPFSVFFLPTILLKGTISLLGVGIIVTTHIVLLYGILKYGVYYYQVGVLNYTEINFKEFTRRARETYKARRK